MSIFNVKINNEWVPITAFKGDKGDKGDTTIIGFDSVAKSLRDVNSTTGIFGVYENNNNEVKFKNLQEKTADSVKETIYDFMYININSNEHKTNQLAMTYDNRLYIRSKNGSNFSGWEELYKKPKLSFVLKQEMKVNDRTHNLEIFDNDFIKTDGENRKLIIKISDIEEKNPKSLKLFCFYNDSEFKTVEIPLPGKKIFDFLGSNEIYFTGMDFKISFNNYDEGLTTNIDSFLNRSSEIYIEGYLQF